MINSTSKTDNILRPDTIAGRPAQTRPTTAPSPTETDTIRASSQENLKAALNAQPEVRPEVLERAKQLLADGNYPPREIIRRLSEMLVKSADLSE